MNTKFGPRNRNKDHTTDHFVLIVAMGSDSKGSYYRFFDPGRKDREKGVNLMNRLYMDKLSGFFKNEKYTLVWVRPSVE